MWIPSVVLLDAWPLVPMPAPPPVRGLCRPGEPAHVEAARELEALNLEVGRLPPGADPRPLVDRLDRLTDSQCFDRLEGPSLAGTSREALRTYWSDGGYLQLRSWLDLGNPGPVMLHEPPTVRTVLSGAIPEGHPLHPLLCPPTDDRCGRETDEWRDRAQATLDRETSGEHRCEERPGRKRPSTPAECGPHAARFAPARRFAQFRSCLRDVQPQRRAFPLGRLRAPTEGWLVISGRRGHYDFCDELRAFDLTTGAMLRVGSCSALALLPGGSVDGRATDRARGLEIQRGHVPVAAVRELTWMLLMQDHIQSDVATHSVSAVVPDSVRRSIGRQRDDDLVQFGQLCFGGAWSSGDTTLTWQAKMGGQFLASGTLRWPIDRNDPAGNHAVSLLQSMESAFVPGCPQARPPRGLFEESPSPRAHRLDSDADSLRNAGSELAKGWRRALEELEACARPAADAGR